MGVDLRRVKIKSLEKWHNSRDRKPLIIRGARQVGKSTLVRLFAKEQNLRLLEVNLEKRKQWNALFETNDIKKIINEVEGLLDVKVDLSKGSKDILFFDECQATPFLLGALRYFYEDFPNLAVVTAGSLLEFALEKYQTSLPVGRVEYLYLGPMTFKEFLWALNEDKIVEALSQIKQKFDISQSLHERILKHQRAFLFVGGMPEAVLKFSKTEDFRQVKKIQSEILDVYRDDFNKYARDSMHPRLHMILDYSLLHVGEKVVYSKISKDFQSKELKRGIDLLSQARVVTKVFNTNSQGIPLKKGIDPNTFKLLFLDVGLLNVGLRLDWWDIINMSERELLNEGPLAEQFIGQHIREWHDDFEEAEIFYWLREGRSNAAEVDFIFQKSRDLVGIEVKAGASGSMRSLHQWNKDIAYPRKKSLRFDLNLPSKFKVSRDDVTYELRSLPLYLVAFMDPFEIFQEEFSPKTKTKMPFGVKK